MEGEITELETNKVTFWVEEKLPEDFELSSFHTYSAPDLIWPPISNKNEFARIEKCIFINSNQISMESLPEGTYYYNYQYVFSFDKIEYEFSHGVESMIDVPLGILAGMNREQAEAYNRQKSELMRSYFKKT